MKIRIIDHRVEQPETIEAKSGVEVYDGKGNIYLIRLNKFGELEINGTDGSLIIEPYMSNEIIIKTRE